MSRERVIQMLDNFLSWCNSVDGDFHSPNYSTCQKSHTKPDKWKFRRGFKFHTVLRNTENTPSSDDTRKTTPITQPSHFIDSHRWRTFDVLWKKLFVSSVKTCQTLNSDNNNNSQHLNGNFYTWKTQAFFIILCRIFPTSRRFLLLPSRQMCVLFHLLSKESLDVKYEYTLILLSCENKHLSRYLLVNCFSNHM